MRRIDLQSHWYPPRFADTLCRRKTHPRCEKVEGAYVYEPAPGERWPWPERFTNLELQLETMRDAGIATVVSSPAVWGDVSVFEPSEAAELSLLLNEEFASAQRSFPGRFLGLATLPLQSPERSLDILDHAVSDLALSGVCLHGNVAGEQLGAERFWPVYRRAAELRLPLVMHPSATRFSELLREGDLQVPLGFLYDTSTAAISLIVSGLLDELPDLDIVHPHLGGVLPYIVGRIDQYRSRNQKWTHLEHSVAEYLQRFWIDTAARDPGAMALACETYGRDHVLFATDYPYWDPEPAIRFAELTIPEAERPAVMAGNALTLLGRAGRASVASTSE